MLDETDRKDLENVRLRLRVLSGMHKLDAIENGDGMAEHDAGDAEGKSVAYGKAADHIAALLDGDYGQESVTELVDDLPEEWSMNLLRYAAYSERTDD
ncbi:hypothetical protein C448_02538 [Halococcus morrhuae DSM 1307]|uniref:Uncharacterized protein n=2 Tax=Halococcus TaxID=2249 RepID=M0MSJ9_HALMO|nr:MULTISPECIES: hypothetical protein [Halococcus]EMA48712.1 hypothetical protein C448_02538 [Halococcus morrhuae DSM 1307]UOO95854.1 hypothetical protein MUK72_03865 [Halococcus dombrowskii]